MAKTLELNLKKRLPIVYLGCFVEKGHFFFTKGMQRLDSSEWIGTGLSNLDGSFTPTDTLEQGKACFHVGISNGILYMVISFWDYSVDKRYNSNSTFLICCDKYESFNDAIQKCREEFPEVFARFTFPITLHRNMFITQ